MAGELQEYHHVWLAQHGQDPEWLWARMAEGFHIHHIDGDHDNNAAENLCLVWGRDHITKLHRVRGKNHGKGKARKRRAAQVVDFIDEPSPIIQRGGA